MTKHNLREHLSWLLRSCNTVNYPHSPIQNLQSVSLLEHTVEPTLSSIDGCARISEVGTLGTRSHAEGIETITEFIRPQLPASALRARFSDDMAKLQSGSRSGHKPRLLSEEVPLSLHTPESSAARAPGTSLAASYTTQFNRRKDGECPYSLTSLSNWLTICRWRQ